MATLLFDTCSIIHLHDIYVRRRHITYTLEHDFEAVITTDAFTELRRHKGLLFAYESKILRFFERRKRTFHKQRRYEDSLRNQFAPAANPNKNRGERLSYAFCLHRARMNTENVIVFLTDDFNARRGFGSWFDRRFPVTHSWNSLDLILYIYLLQDRKWTLGDAASALRTVNARIGGTPSEAVTRFMEYRKRLTELDASLVELQRSV
jgi:hypothetical protein